MSSSKYIEKDGQVYLSIDDRLYVKWEERWVPVSEEIELYLKKITVDPTDITLNVGVSDSFIITFDPSDYPNKKVVYSGYDESIISLNKKNKTITAVKEGNTKLIIASQDRPEIKTEINITVVVSPEGE